MSMEEVNALFDRAEKLNKVELKRLSKLMPASEINMNLAWRIAVSQRMEVAWQQIYNSSINVISIRDLQVGFSSLWDDPDLNIQNARMALAQAAGANLVKEFIDDNTFKALTKNWNKAITAYDSQLES